MGNSIGTENSDFAKVEEKIYETGAILGSLWMLEEVNCCP